MSDYFSFLDKQKHVNLITFRKSGEKVTTPVWFEQDDNRLVVMTDEISGKLKRIRNNPHVEIAPSDKSGKSLGDEVPAQARILPSDQAHEAEKLLKKKYGLEYKMFEETVRKATQVFLEIMRP